MPIRRAGAVLVLALGGLAAWRAAGPASVAANTPRSSRPTTLAELRRLALAASFREGGAPPAAAPFTTGEAPIPGAHRLATAAWTRSDDVRGGRPVERLALTALPAIDRCLGRPAAPRIPQLVRLVLVRAGTAPDGEARFVATRASAAGAPGPGADAASRCLAEVAGREVLLDPASIADETRTLEASVDLPLPLAGPAPPGAAPCDR